MGKLVKAYWDCQYCQEKGISGDVRECPGCGKARDESVKFYMKDNVEYLTKEEADKKRNGADWFCDFCHSYNSADATECSSCGAPRTEGAGKDYHQMQADIAAKKAAKAAEAAKAQEAYTGGKKKSPIRFVLLGLLLVIAAFIIFKLIPKKTDMNVVGIDWKRTVSIEQNQYLEFSDWSLPDGADLIETREEIKSYDKVLDHYDKVPVEKTREVQNGYDTEYVDQGNGTFEEVKTPHYDIETYTEYEKKAVYREDPVYATKYYYNAWAYVEVRVEESAGKDHDVFWPEIYLEDGEREGAKTEEYTFTVADKKGKVSTYYIDEAIWNTIDIDDAVTIKNSNGSYSLLDESGKSIATIYEKR